MSQIYLIVVSQKHISQMQKIVASVDYVFDFNSGILFYWDA